MELMRVPAGKFLMGSSPDNKKAFDSEKPQHSVDISYDYWMARFQVTNEQYNAYAGSQKLQHPVDGWQEKKAHPVVNVSWKDAMAYGEWLNNVLQRERPAGLVPCLPTEAEWEKAARGTEGHEFPWGNQFFKYNCNTREGHKGRTTSVGTYSPRGDSPFGIADMVGNVSEWTHSLMKKYPYNAADGREDENASGDRVNRGGSFLDKVYFARCACRGHFHGINNSLGFL
jgi:formylglycine-generating enzyme required for sulfatase activity